MSSWLRTATADRRAGFAISALAACLVTTPCLPAAAAAGAQQQEYRLRYGDAISVQVAGQPDMSVIGQAIRPDGRVMLPFVSEVDVAGKTAAQVAADLGQAYSRFVTKPYVTVNISRFRPVRVTVLGQVARPGNHEFQEVPGLVDVLAAAGGLTDRAERSQIRVVAPGVPARVYHLDRLLAGDEAIPAIHEEATVEVVEVWYPDLYRFVPIAASVITAAAVLLRN